MGCRKLRHENGLARLLLRCADSLVPWNGRAQAPGNPDRAGQPILMKTMTQMGAREPSAAAPLQGGDPALRRDGGLVEQRMIEFRLIENQ